MRPVRRPAPAVAHQIQASLSSALPGTVERQAAIGKATHTRLAARPHARFNDDVLTCGFTGSYSPHMLVDRLDLSPDDFERLTGWAIKTEGACKGESCLPLPDQSSDQPFDLVATAARLGMAVVEDADDRLWAFGPETLTGRALTTVDTSDFSLPDLDGNEFRLSALRGQKVLLVAWAPY